jgi:ribosome-binding factor A
MPQTHRIERVNQLIRQELSQLLQRGTKDPRLGGYISITAVETTPDLRHARVFVSCICDDEKKKEILAALGHSSGFFRTELAKHLTMRRVPELHYTWDDSIEKGANLLALMDRVKSEDSSRSQEN